jgi:hypothetical protein
MWTQKQSAEGCTPVVEADHPAIVLYVTGVGVS